METRIFNGDEIELTNEADLVLLWFDERTKKFCLMLNSKLIKSTKTWKPIENKLNSINDLKEVQDV